MKIEKTNPHHWLLLALFGANVALAILLRPFVRQKPGTQKRVILYGHKLSGNLLAIQRQLLAAHAEEIEPVFLTMDPAYYRRLLADGEPACLATSPAFAWLLARADAIISDHGLHAMQPMLSLTNLKFLDVWHGIPFKGFDADDFRVQHRYDETWVASPLLAELYPTQFEFDAASVNVTMMQAQGFWPRENRNADSRLTRSDPLGCA